MQDLYHQPYHYYFFFFLLLPGYHSVKAQQPFNRQHGNFAILKHLAAAEKLAISSASSSGGFGFKGSREFGVR